MRAVPPVPPTPQAVKVKLIKVVSSQSFLRDLQSTSITEQLQQPAEKNICKITINGKESTVPDYNPKSKEIQKPKVSDSNNFSPTSSPKCSRKIPGTGDNITTNKQGKADNVHIVKFVKGDSRTCNDDIEDPKVKFVPRPQLSEHEGPIIWDPFEQIREQNKRSTEHHDVKREGGKARAKSAKGNNNRLVVPRTRKLSAKNRNNSATKRNVKVKPTVEANKTLRPKSPKKKGVRKTKKNPNSSKDFANKQDSEHVTFASGTSHRMDYGQTPTFTKVKPFKFKPTDDYSSDEEDYSHSLIVLPDFTAGLLGNHSKNATPRSFREVRSLLPNMAVCFEDLEEYTSGDESDEEEIY